MSEEQGVPRRRTIIIVVVVLSVVLYLAGVFSGLYANKLVKQETGEDIRILKQETEGDILNLRLETENDLDQLGEYLTVLETNLRDMQLEQTFMDSLDDDAMCDYSEISLDKLFDQLRFYWERLPFRLEEFEFYTDELPEEYVRLKQDYALVSIRTWILAKNQRDICNGDVYHGLHFYEGNCAECVEQSKEIEAFARQVVSEEKDLILFPVDFGLDQTIVKNLVSYYGINETPAVVLNDVVLQGRVFEMDELLAVIDETNENETISED